jgi:aryl-alcohol dehydrogenase-like predicted oxidoreductase
MAMRTVEVNGVRISRIGVGCWQFGSSDWGYGNGYESTAVTIVHRALELGVNLLDTAELYARGASEAIVGRAIEGRRPSAFVATKLWPVLPTAARTFEHGRLSAVRLGVDTIDLYQVHFPNPVVPLRQTMEGMRRLQDAGLVRHVGVSNYSADWWRRAEADLGRPVLSNQVQYSLVRRRPERAVLPYAQEHDRVVIAYSPLAQGLLGGRYDIDHRPTNPARRQNPLFLPENLERADPLIRALRDVARAHDATPAQVALAWLLRRPNVVAIPGASSVAQLEHNVLAADLELTEDDDARLTGASDAFEPIGGPAVVPKLVKARFARTAA